MDQLNMLLEVFILDIFNSRDLNIDSNLDIITANVTVEYSEKLAATFMHYELSKYLDDKLNVVKIGTVNYNMVRVNLYGDSYKFAIQPISCDYALIITKDNMFFSRNYNRLIEVIGRCGSNPTDLMSAARDMSSNSSIIDTLSTGSIDFIYPPKDRGVKIEVPECKVYSVKSLQTDERSNRDSPILVFTEDETMFIRNELIDVLKYTIKLLKEYYLVNGKGPFEYLPKYDQHGLADVVDYYNSYKTIKKRFDDGFYSLRSNGDCTKEYHSLKIMIGTHRDLLIDKFKLYALSPYNDPESPKLYKNWLAKILKKQYLIKSNECY